MATITQISPVQSGNHSRAAEAPAYSATASKIEKFFTSFEGAMTIFSILAGAVIAILWSVPIGLLGTGVGIAASLAIHLCRSSEAEPANNKPPMHATLAEGSGEVMQQPQPPAPIVAKRSTAAELASNKPRTSPGNEWYADLMEGSGEVMQQPQPPAPIVAKRFTGGENVRIYRETMAHAAREFANSNNLLTQNVSVQVGLPSVIQPVKYPDMRVYVANKSTLRMTQDLVERGLKPLVLDMANAYHAGGGVRNGANAQEEIVCRQSNAMVGLLKMEGDGKFPIPELGGFLLPGVTFFRADPNENYAFLDTPFRADVFALAAYCCTQNGDRPPSDELYRANTVAKIENYLRAAIANGNDSIVASALGCGAFLNDPVFIANLFKEILEKPEFKGQFKEVAFGIIEDKNSQRQGGKGNYQTFKEILEG